MRKLIKVLLYNIDTEIFEQLADFSDIEISANSDTFKKCMHFAETLSPDVILADGSLSSEKANVLKTNFPSIRLVTFSAIPEADAYCGSELSAEEIHIILQLTVFSEMDLNISSVNNLIAKMQNASLRREQLLDLYRKLFLLSKGEFALLRALCRGESYESIAQKKFIALDSVRRMSNRLVKRLGEKNLDSLLKRLNSLGAFDFSDNIGKHDKKITDNKD